MTIRRRDQPERRGRRRPASPPPVALLGCHPAKLRHHYRPENLRVAADRLRAGLLRRMITPKEMET